MAQPIPSEPGFEAGGPTAQGPPRAEEAAAPAPGPGPGPLPRPPLHLSPSRCCQPTSPTTAASAAAGPPSPSFASAISVLVPPTARDTHPSGSTSAGPLPAPQAAPSTCLQPTGALLSQFSRASVVGVVLGGAQGLLGSPRAPPPPVALPTPPKAGPGHCSSLRLLPSLLAASCSYPNPHLCQPSPPMPASFQAPTPAPPPLSCPSASVLSCPPPQTVPPLQAPLTVSPPSGPQGPPCPSLPSPPYSAPNPITLCRSGSPSWSDSLSVCPSVLVSVGQALSVSLAFSAITISSHTAVQSQAVPQLAPSPPHPSSFLSL